MKIRFHRPQYLSALFLLSLTLPACEDDDTGGTLPTPAGMPSAMGTDTLMSASTTSSGIDTMNSMDPTGDSTDGMGGPGISSQGGTLTGETSSSGIPDTGGSSTSSGDTNSANNGSDNTDENPKIKHEIVGDDMKTTIDANSNVDWVFLDLDRQMFWQAPFPTQLRNNEWDLSFKRYEIRLNGGHNGMAGVEALWIEGQFAYEMLKQSPAEGFKTDAAPIPMQSSGLFFEDWYDYNFMTHILTPKERAYVLRSSENKYYKFKMLDYYRESDEKSGHPQFLWAPIQAP